MEATTQPASAPPHATRDLQALSVVVSQMEAVISETAAVLDAIMSGGLLDAAPPDREDAQRFNTANILLDLLRSRVRQIEELPGTDVSITLRVMADDAAKQETRS